MQSHYDCPHERGSISVYPVPLTKSAFPHRGKRETAVSGSEIRALSAELIPLNRGVVSLARKGDECNIREAMAHNTCPATFQQLDSLRYPCRGSISRLVTAKPARAKV